MVTESQKKYNADYKKENMVQMQFRLNKITDPDIISFLKTIENRQGYIKELIRRDMELEKIYPLYQKD